MVESDSVFRDRVEEEGRRRGGGEEGAPPLVPASCPPAAVTGAGRAKCWSKDDVMWLTSAPRQP